MTKTKLSPHLLLSSVAAGLALGVAVLLLDMIVSKLITERTTLFPSGDGAMVSRVILFFLAMSFVLLLRALMLSEQIWRRTLFQADSDYLQLFNSVGFCVVVYSVHDEGRKFIIKEFNSFAEKTEKISADKVVGRDVREVFPGIDKFGLTDVMRRVFLSGVPEVHDISQYADERISGWRQNYVFRTRNGDVVCVYQDMTERIETDLKLKTAESELGSIMEALPMFFIVFDRKGRVSQIAGKAVGQIGLDPAKAKGLGIEELFKANDKFRDCVSSARNGLDFSSRIDFNGKLFDVRFHPFFSGDAGGNVVAIGYDVGERASAEIERERLEAAISQTDEVVIVTRPDGVIEYANPAFEKVTGFTVGEALGRNTRFLKSGKHDKVFYEDLWRTIRAGDVWRGHFFNRRKDGAIYEEEAVISPVKAKNGEIVNYVAVKRDVTREVDLQKQLIQAQKMEAIGRLAGGIAHDFNNILTAILGYSDLALSQIRGEEGARESVEQIRMAGKRAASLTKQLLAFTRKQVMNMQPVCVKEIVSDIHDMIRRIIGDDVSISYSLPDDRLMIKADRGQIEQVIMNLVLNARDAVPGTGGRIGVSASRHVQTVPYDYAGFSAAPGEFVKISFRDNGHGMSDEVKLKIFEPFFTTKPKGKGTGLGLSTVYGIVKQHSGFITFESELGKGTTFDVFIPAPEKEAVSKSAAEMQEAGDLADAVPKGAVLLAEDDKVLQMLVSSYLGREGFKVLVAGDGLEAKQMLAQRGEEIKFALIDLVMPFMDGGKLAEYTMKTRPDVKIILMSGYPDVIDTIDPRIKALPLLPKPFSQEELKSEVKRSFGT